MSYDHEEAHRRASRNGRVSDLPPEVPTVTIRFCVAAWRATGLSFGLSYPKLQGSHGALGVTCVPQGNFYPGTGRPDETGRGEGLGFNVNIAWQTGGVADGDYMAAFTAVVLPVAHAFQPDLTIISAGFDAAAGTPLLACCAVRR